MEGDVQSKEDFIRAVSEDSNNYMVNLQRMEQALEEKDNIIRYIYINIVFKSLVCIYIHVKIINPQKCNSKE